MTLKSTELTPRIASAIHASKEDLLSGKYAKEIRALLEQRGVLVFPQVNFNDEEQVAFTNTLGTFAPEHDGEIIYKVTLDTKVNPKAEVVYYGQATLEARGKELTMARFTVSPSGGVDNINTIPKSLMSSY